MFSVRSLCLSLPSTTIPSVAYSSSSALGLQGKGEEEESGAGTGAGAGAASRRVLVGHADKSYLAVAMGHARFGFTGSLVNEPVFRQSSLATGNWQLVCTHWCTQGALVE